MQFFPLNTLSFLDLIPALRAFTNLICKANIISNLNHEIDQSSKESKKDIQKLLVALGYDISYISKSTGKLVTGSDAIDGDL